MSVHFAISSNRDFYHHTLPVIVPSLLRLGYDPNTIWFFVGDETTEFGPLMNKYGIQAYRVPIRAFEFTAPLAIIDYFPEPDRYWFLMHDTCEAGLEFRTRLDLLLQIGEFMPLVSYGQNNMGLCRTDHLIQRRKQLDSYRGYPTEQLLELKRKIVEEEGQFFKGAKTGLCGHPILDHAAPNDFTLGVIGRKREYWADIDLVKFKSNYGGPNPYNLDL
jgi:hypothetical protein